MPNIINPVTASNIKYTSPATGAVAQSVEGKLAGIPTYEDLGIVADGVTTETTKVLNFATAKKAADKVKHAIVSSNQDTGGALLGDELLQETASGRIINPVSAETSNIFNLHLLQPWLQKFNGENKSTSNSEALPQKKIVISGDSTTVGYISGVSIAPEPPHVLLAQYSKLRGYSNVIVVNNGQAGDGTNHWNATHVLADIAANPDLLILRWGINDPAYAQTVEMFTASLRNGLAQVRASKTVFQLSIVLMTPNSTAHIPDGRDEFWHESINKVIRQAALDYDCVFIDLYAMCPRSHGLSNSIIFDTIGGYAVHPTQSHYVQIANIIADVVFPQYSYAVNNNFLNLTSVDTANNFDSSTTNASIYNGLTMNFSSSSSFVGYAGSLEQLITFKSIDSAMITISAGLAGYNDANQFARGSGRRPVGLVARCSFNAGNSTVLGVVAYPTLLNGWANLNNGLQEVMYQTTLDGRVCFNGVLGPNPSGDGAIIFTLPTALAPMQAEIFAVLKDNGICRVDVTDAGNVIIYGSGSAGFVSLSGINFKFGAH